MMWPILSVLMLVSCNGKKTSMSSNHRNKQSMICHQVHTFPKLCQQPQRHMSNVNLKTQQQVYFFLWESILKGYSRLFSSVPKKVITNLVYYII